MGNYANVTRSGPRSTRGTAAEPSAPPIWAHPENKEIDNDQSLINVWLQETLHAWLKR